MGQETVPSQKHQRRKENAVKESRRFCRSHTCGGSGRPNRWKSICVVVLIVTFLALPYTKIGVKLCVKLFRQPLTHYAQSIYNDKAEDLRFGLYHVDYNWKTETVDFSFYSPLFFGSEDPTGIYYSPNNEPGAYYGHDMDFIKRGNGWYWKEENGDNWMYTEKITDNWYWFEFNW